ncbi:MAG: nucleotidyltransferase family protein [Candidatus Izemoplasmatales bacterium]|jgi:molybdenum cofactor cytidylyltransferase
MAEGIILAGGYSSRMSENKMTKPLWGIPLILHAVQRMKPIVARVVIVTGYYHEPIASLFSMDSQIEIIHNDQYALGMFSSVQCGVRAIQSDLFILPGDYPLIHTETYTELLQAQGAIRVPTYEGKRGHPLFMVQELRDALLKEPIDSNLKRFRDQFPVSEVAVDDSGILKDVDTFSDWMLIEHLMEGRG